jgi:methionyl-tRNA synthetase
VSVQERFANRDIQVLLSLSIHVRLTACVADNYLDLCMQVELVEPPAGAAIGECIRVEGYAGEPDEQLPPKKKIFEAVQPDLATNDARVACYKGVPLMTSSGPCTVCSVVGGSIK